MAKRKPKKSTKRSIEPMPWQDFVLGFQVATQAIERLNGPEVSAPFMDQAQGARGRQDPFYVVAMAVGQHFGREYAHLNSFHYRFWALMELLDNRQIDRFVLEQEEGVPRRLHPALLLAAAEVKLTKNGKFPSRRFVARAEEIIRIEGEGEDSPPAAISPEDLPHDLPDNPPAEETSPDPSAEKSE